MLKVFADEMLVEIFGKPCFFPAAIQSYGCWRCRRHRPAAVPAAEAESVNNQSGAVRSRTGDPGRCRRPVPHGHPRQGRGLQRTRTVG